MALLPLSVYDSLRRALLQCSSSIEMGHDAIAERLCATASLTDLIRWRRVSRAFRRAAERRLSQYSHIHVRVYEGLTRIHKSTPNEKSKLGLEGSSWHPSACLLMCEISAQTIGIAIDSKPTWKDVGSLIRLLQFFRNSVEQIHMDSPIIEILLREMNSQKVNALLEVLCKSRPNSAYSYSYADHCVPAPVHLSSPLTGPFFPKLKQFTVTSNPSQLNTLSRLSKYAVAVDMIFSKEKIDLVCLQVILGNSWCRSKQRLFRHVNTFKKWSEASDLGVKYVQQFQGETPRKRKG